MTFGNYNIPIKYIDNFGKIVNSIVFDNSLNKVNTEIGDYSSINGSQYILTDFENELKTIIEYYEKQIFNAKLILNSAWVIYGEKGSFHTIHTHAKNRDDVNETDICTVLYLETTQDEYPFSCFHAYLNEEQVSPDVYTYCPKRGDLIWFSPITPHGTYPQGDGLRQTLNMDFTIYNK